MYGFQPGRGQHDALDALCVAIKGKRVNWILDAEIKGFFDAVDHQLLLRFVGHRVGDERIVRLVGKWLKARVMVDGNWSASAQGTPQGAVISPLLVNVYLYHVSDLWARQWRQREALLYADDLLVGFEHEADARRFWDAMRERFEQFALELHWEKTPLLEFGRYAIERRQRTGQGKPQSSTSCGSRSSVEARDAGHFCCGGIHDATAGVPALQEVNTQLRTRRHDSIAEQGRWLRSVVTGYFAYHAV